MAAWFSPDYMPLWALVLAALLFLPVRHLIWVLMVRRAEREGPTDPSARARLRQRAAVTAGLLCLVFAFLYTATLFSPR